MLEGNHLYRRIEHKNLFRTFSRTYSRPTHPHHSIKAHQNQSEQNQNSQNTTNNLPSSKQKLYQTSSVEVNTQRNQMQQSMPIIFSQKFNISQFRKEMAHKACTLPVEFQVNNRSELSSNSKEFNWNENSLNHKFSGNMLNSWKQRRKDQKFKLKSCMQKKTVSYQTDWEEADFSLITQKESTAKINQLKTQFGTLSSKRGKTSVGKRGMSGLFPKYSRLLQQMIKKKKQYNNSIGK